MKAIVLAAGQGTRLRPLTDDRPKCMVQFHGKPILFYIIEAMRASNIQDITIVKGYRQEMITVPGTKSILNRDFASTNMVATLFCAESEMNSDLVVSYSDIVYRQHVLQALIECQDDFCVCVDTDWKTLWEARMEDPLRDAETMKIDKAGYILELGKKPQSLSEIQGQYMGLFKISGRIIESVIDFYHSLSREDLYDGRDLPNMYMTAFIQQVIDKLLKVKAVTVSGGWVEIDSVKDLELPWRD